MAPKTRNKKKNTKAGLKKCLKRTEQVKQAMRRYRQKMTEEQIEERKRKDRERYKRKKEQGLIKGINEMTPRSKKKVKKLWKERSKKYRDKKKQKEQIQRQTEEFAANETPPDSPIPSSSRSRVESGRKIQEKNKRHLKLENILLKERLRQMEARVKKYKMRYNRVVKKGNSQEVISNNNKCKINETKKRIQHFLESDECSRLTAGKKETITRHKIKKQIRLLNDTLLNLYSKFKKTVTNKISYSLFCRYRPFWIISPTARQRDTCLCIHHTNMELIVTALKSVKVINEATPVALVKSICCEGKLKENCLLRKCNNCKNKKPQINNFQQNEPVNYYRWITKKYPVIIKGSEKIIQKTIKEKIVSPKKDLIQLMQSKLPDFMKHLNNIYHQYQTFNLIKRQMNEETALLHIDFAENYICKYAEEVQAVHFGGSKPQISLHTAVLYHYGELEPIITPFCTISENLRHDPVFICNHLYPLLKIIKELHPDLKTIHFVSDGPSSQYRNKSMFFLMANFLAVNSNVQNLIWHYNEAGHGKGPPDGVGATVKRTADQAVARGKDVSNFQQLIECLTDDCKGIQIIPINDEIVPTIESLLTKSLTPTFKGTLNIHQITWTKDCPNLLHARKLSCTECLPGQICPHYEMGVINTEPSQISSQPNEVVHSSQFCDDGSTHASSDTETFQGMSSPDSVSQTAGPSNLANDDKNSSGTLDSLDPFESVRTSAAAERRVSISDDDFLSGADQSRPIKVAVLSERSHKFYRKPKAQRRIILDSPSSSDENIF